MVKIGGDAMLDVITDMISLIINKNKFLTTGIMQFVFMSGRTTTDAIFILRKMQEKRHLKRKTMYAALVDLEKAFNRVPRKVLWWGLRKLGVDEWVIRLFKAMYSNAQSNVREWLI